MSFHTIRPLPDQEAGLACYLNLGSLNDLPASSQVPDAVRQADWQQPDAAAVQALRDAGYTGAQGGSPAGFAAFGFGATAGGGVKKVGDLDEPAKKRQDEGFQAMTLHVGTGLETDAEADALVDHVVTVADRLQFPISIETHRATITQDIERTLRLTERHPDVRFNGDFSHWYTGLEMVYGDFDGKLDALEPVFERVTHLHGRIGTPGSIQTPLQGHEDATYVQHFSQIWTRVFAAFRRTAPADRILVFAPELLHPAIYYAPVDAQGQEFSDRWIDCQIMSDIARRCWKAAQPAMA